MLGAVAASALEHREERARDREHPPATEVVGERADREQRGGQPETHPAERPRLARDAAVKRTVAVADRGHDRAEHRKNEQRSQRRDRERPVRLVRPSLCLRNMGCGDSAHQRLL